MTIPHTSRKKHLLVFIPGAEGAGAGRAPPHFKINQGVFSRPAGSGFDL